MLRSTHKWIETSASTTDAGSLYADRVLHKTGGQALNSPMRKYPDQP
jgi:hypothetical protein